MFSAKVWFIYFDVYWVSVLIAKIDIMVLRSSQGVIHYAFGYEHGFNSVKYATVISC